MQLNGEWFRQTLADRKLSQRKLAKLLDLDPAAVSLMFRGQRRMTTMEAQKLSAILHVPTTEVLRQAGIPVTEDARKVHITAHIDAAGTVHLFPSGTFDDVIGPADCPTGTYAIQVRTPQLATDGWLFFVTPAQRAADEQVESLCLVASTKGLQNVAIIKRGYRRQTHNLLLWPDFKLVTDADIAWCSPVLWVKPK
jgi:transcriptional regulator with XRE-family HTH domain